MSQLDELLARSRAPGAFVERRHFTLSREKAIEKQREFALTDPRNYVLEILQGAIFAGATYLAVDARKHDILIAWVGAPPLEQAQLENLFDYLFADRTDRRIRHLVQLAVGINALLQSNPAGITIESGAGGKTLRFDMGPDGQADIGKVANPIEGTYLVARFGGTWLSRFLGPHALTRVEDLIEKRCLYTPVPILLNNTAPFGFRATRNIEIFGARAQEQFDHGDRRGVIALHGSPKAPKGFRIVVGGVWITDHPLSALSDHDLVGVICDDNLRKTADHGGIVEEVRFQRMLHAVQPHATKLLKQALGPTYQPPRLDPVPDEVEVDPSDTSGPRIEYEPLPDVLVLAGPRGTTSLLRLQAAGDEPLFWCTPEVGKQLDDAADPERFPFRIVVLPEPQANTLGREVPGIHRLNGPSDIDFVLRVMERGRDVRELRVPLGGPARGRSREIVLRLHRSGRLPAWGNGALGVPTIIRFDGKTQYCGAVDGTRVFLSRVPPHELSVPLDLPGVSLVVESHKEAALLDDDLARRALDAAWQLVVPPGWTEASGEPLPELGDAEVRLLAALLANQSLPQLSEDPHPVGATHHPDAIVRLGASLPPSWPTALRRVPLVETSRGPLDLDGFLALIQDGEVAWVRDPEQYARMEPLEARFGYGHLAPYGVDATPLFAVMRIGDRWLWVDDRQVWRQHGTFTHLVCVGRHFAARSSDPRWHVDQHPFPELFALRRDDAEPVDLDEAWDELFTALKRVELDNAWARYAHDAGVARVQAMGRLALLHLATLRAHGLDERLLLPSDGGARWSIERLRSDPDARVAAANGVIVAEPRTFLLTADELRAVVPTPGPAGSVVRLRYDDHPDVWRSLAQTSDEGWLLRTEIHEARLRGWLGFRLPYDATSGILLRTTGQLVALPELDAKIPCHGLLWPTHGQGTLSADERQLLQLAGLRMYAQLLARMRERLSPEESRSAQLYAWAFCWRAHRRGRLSGTAMQLARQVEVLGEDGRTWGTLDRWLETAAARRPAPPPEISPPPEPDEPAPDAGIRGPKLSTLTDRTNAALGRLDVEVTAAELGRAAPVTVEPENRERARFLVVLNTDHALVHAGMRTPGPAQELLLLEIARQVVLCARTTGHELDLLRTHQVLLSQRLED